VLDALSTCTMKYRLLSDNLLKGRVVVCKKDAGSARLLLPLSSVPHRYKFISPLLSQAISTEWASYTPIIMITL